MRHYRSLICIKLALDKSASHSRHANNFRTHGTYQSQMALLTCLCFPFIGKEEEAQNRPLIRMNVP